MVPVVEKGPPGDEVIRTVFTKDKLLGLAVLIKDSADYPLPFFVWKRFTTAHAIHCQNEPTFKPV